MTVWKPNSSDCGVCTVARWSIVTALLLCVIIGSACRSSRSKEIIVVEAEKRVTFLDANEPAPYAGALITKSRYIQLVEAQMELVRHEP